MDGIPLIAAQILTGIGLAACAGLRAFLPMLVVGIAGRAGWVPLSDSFEWMASTPALVIFGVAVVTEILGDKFPVVDHVLDVAQSWVKPIAGTILAAAVLTELSPLQATVLGIVTGGSTAGVVQVVKAKARLLSTATTGGIANPVLSAGEDAGSLVGSVAAMAAPVLVGLVLVAGIVAVVIVLQRRRRPPGHSVP